MNHPITYIFIIALAVTLGGPARAQTTLPERYDRLRASVVQIECRYFLDREFLDLAQQRLPPDQYRQFNQEFGGALPGYGSGFFIDERGAVVTNSHVVAPVLDHAVVDGKTYKATLGDVYVVRDVRGEKFRSRAYVRLRHQAYDLAILTTTLSDTVPLPFDFDDRPEIGDSIIVPGYPMGIAPAELLKQVGARRLSDYNKYPDMTLNSGRVTALLRSRTEDEQLLQIDARVNPGNSGSPLLNADDRVVGIITYKISQAEGLGYAIPVWLARDFLGFQRDEPTTATQFVMTMEIITPTAEEFPAAIAETVADSAPRTALAAAIASATPALAHATSKYFVASTALIPERWMNFDCRVYALNDYPQDGAPVGSPLTDITSQRLGEAVRWPFQYFVIDAVNRTTRRIQFEPRHVTFRMSDGAEFKSIALGSMVSLSTLPASWRGAFASPAWRPGERRAFLICADARVHPASVASIDIALDTRTTLTLEPQEP